MEFFLASKNCPTIFGCSSMCLGVLKYIFIYFLSPFLFPFPFFFSLLGFSFLERALPFLFLFSQPGLAHLGLSLPAAQLLSGEAVWRGASRPLIPIVWPGHPPPLHVGDELLSRRRGHRRRRLSTWPGGLSPIRARPGPPRGALGLFPSSISPPPLSSARSGNACSAGELFDSAPSCDAVRPASARTTSPSFLTHPDLHEGCVATSN